MSKSGIQLQLLIYFSYFVFKHIAKTLNTYTAE